MRFILSTLGVLVFAIAVGAMLPKSPVPSTVPATTTPDPTEKRSAELQAEQRDQDDRVAKCMGPGAGSLPVDAYKAMLKACDEANPFFDAEIAQEVDKRIAAEHEKLVRREQASQMSEAASSGAPAQ